MEWEEVWDGRRCGDMRKEGMEVFNRRGEGGIIKNVIYFAIRFVWCNFAVPNKCLWVKS